MSKVKLALALVGLIILSCSLCLLLYAHLPYGKSTMRYEIPADDLKRLPPTPESWVPRDSYEVAVISWPFLRVQGLGEVWGGEA